MSQHQTERGIQDKQPYAGRLVWARRAWVLLAIVILGLNVAGIPNTYAKYYELCFADVAICDEEGYLTPAAAAALEELGLSRHFYAAYQGVGIETLFTLVCCAVASVIIARGAGEPMAVMAAFVLLLFGGAGAAGTMRGLLDIYSAFWFPVKLLDYLSQVSFGVFFLVFPDGRFVPRWTRWIAALTALAFIPDIFFPESSLATLVSPIFYVYTISLGVVQVYRFRRVSSPVQRQQTKWVVFGFAVALVGFLVLLILPVANPEMNNRGPLFYMVFSTLIYAFLLLIPLAIAMAMLRSGLWDIDVIIRRTLVYSTLSVLLGMIYVGSIVVSRWLVAPLLGSSELTIVISTLAIAALFLPLRRRIQQLIDKRFYRRKYDAAKVLAAFGVTVRDETDLEALTQEMLRVVDTTMQPEFVGLWLRDAQVGSMTEAARPDAKPLR